MAVYQGARVHAAVMPARSAALPRRRMHVPLVTVRGVRPAGAVIGVILIVTLFGLVYLTQTLRSAAASLEVERLLAERAQLERQLLVQQGTIARWNSQAGVTEWAQNKGLDDLGDLLILNAD